MSEDGGVDGLQVGGAGELNLKSVKQRHEAGVQHVASPSRRPHGTHKLDVFHVLPVELLATVIEPLDKQIQPVENQEAMFNDFALACLHCARVAYSAHAIIAL